MTITNPPVPTEFIASLHELPASSDVTIEDWLNRHNPETRNHIILSYLNYAKALAAKLYARRIHDEIPFEEYLQLARIGLIEAVDRFESTAEVKFETYAFTRIRGAILNGITAATEKQRQIAFRQDLIRQRCDSMLERTEVSAQEQALFMLADIAAGLAIGFLLEDSGMYTDGCKSSHESVYKNVALLQVSKRLTFEVGKLQKQEADLIHLHYFQDRSFAEIAAQFGLSKGRISQIHKTAICRLRERLGQASAYFEG